MALLCLTQPADEQQLALFQLWLTAGDALLLRQDACLMMWQANPTPAQGFIRSVDASTLGGCVHPDWQLLSDEQWVILASQHQPNIGW